ncbi:hypothetical protein SLEP1_g36822 [Rubroshorea leprosula]|uniref:Uncharacterized protein n=1 Tax=Rubroshorea leprosula TaxID=152421 RepID=A0AAV5KSQ4_9ROSI|nr:hypothetical protein SLEP1_g36822 [Rubroshorea leprosula]
MDSRRRQKGSGHHRQDMQWRRTQDRKQPAASWQPTVPVWERNFCTLIGCVPWEKLLELHRSMHLYNNVLKWNDSAGEEAFNNAKTRFWAETNNLPCNITLPDPDMYIDEIDWNSEADPELLLDLEREPKTPDEIDKKENVVILGSALLSNQSFSCTGWGDAEEDLGKHNVVSSENKNGNMENPSDHCCPPRESNNKDSGWGQLCDSSWEWNQRETNNESSNIDNGKVGDWGNKVTSGRKREGGGQYMSRYKTSRFQSNNRETDHGWRNVRRHQESNFAYERAPMNSRQWNSMNDCWRNHNNGFSEGGVPRRYEKKVL